MFDYNKDGKIDSFDYAEYRRTHSEDYDSKGDAEVGEFLMTLIFIFIGIVWIVSEFIS